MPKFKPGQSGNPAGRPRKGIRGLEGDDLQALSTLEAIFANTKLAPMARVSAIREYFNRVSGTPTKAKPEADAVTEATARKLCELAELAQCQDCKREHVHHAKPHSVEQPTPRAEAPRVPLAEPTYNPPIPQAIVDAQNEEERERIRTVLVKP